MIITCYTGGSAKYFDDKTIYMNKPFLAAGLIVVALIQLRTSWLIRVNPAGYSPHPV